MGGAHQPPRPRAALAAGLVAAPAAARYDARRQRSAAIFTTLILTQGGLADELLAAARRIVGDGDRLTALGLGWDDSPEVARGKLERLVAELPSEDGLLILTDIYGGTPSNLALALQAPGRVEVVSGVNLPMVVRLACLAEEPRMSLEDMAEWIRAKARSSICRGDQQPRRDGTDGGA